MKKKISIFATLVVMILMSAFSANAQSQASKGPVKWRAYAQMTSETEGILTITANIDPGWHLYGFKQPEDGPSPISFAFSATPGVSYFGSLKYSPKAITQMEEMFGATVSYWTKKVNFTRHFRLTNVKEGTATITVKYMACNDQQCLPPTSQTVTVKIK